ncbi:MAG: 4Fe-4S dicluster domain-containing protein [Candidatus Omnitrophota bacterium]|nr:4Fe-4S dicluster domain-containing protein [Candidatus Omnitrophota bacterium]
MDSYFINKPNLDRLVKSLSKTYKIFAPVKVDNNRFYKKVGEDGLEKSVIGEIRAVEPIKSFYFPARTKIAEYFSSKEDSDAKERPIAIIGAKSCDLASFKVMDYVYSQEPFRDPLYVSKREEGLIISSDCTCYGETCFCVAIGIMPYPTEGFDINLSEMEGGYLAESGSLKGEKIVKEYFKLFQAANPYIEKRDSNRKKLKEGLLEHVKKSRIPPKDSIQSAFKGKFDSSLWEEVAKACVECGACNMICPACHCFILMDQKKENGFERLRMWDSCLLMSFARVAGGANPRKLLAQRMRNRFDKKFNFFPDTIGRFGCTGCGRCTEACPGKIDIRAVLSKLQAS